MSYNTEYMEHVLKEAAHVGGKILLSHFRHEHQIEYKFSHQDFCTQADIESQEAVKQSIIGQLTKMGISEAEIGFIGEENLDEASHKHLFIIDPLDGTTNFESGLDYFAVSIAYCLNGEILEGAIYRPTTNDYYYAKKNGGSFKNNKKLSVSSKPLKECLMDGIISSRPNIYPSMFKILEKIFPSVKGLRSLFCMTLSNCFIAENIINLTINGNTFIWDIAAASLIISEAGGAMFDSEGQPIKPNFKEAKQPYNVITCHPDIKDQVIGLINQ